MRPNPILKTARGSAPHVDLKYSLTFIIVKKRIFNDSINHHLHLDSLHQYSSIQAYQFLKELYPFELYHMQLSPEAHQ